MSSNMVDQNIGKAAENTGNIYMYKNKVRIPPLMMQDDTLAISVCGIKTTKINNFLNTRTNIMGLQFGRDKCVQMHIGKSHNQDICSPCKVDAWTDKIVRHNGKDTLEDEYLGEEAMKTVQEKKYLGDIISQDMKNLKNIREKTNRAVGIVNKIESSLYERPYGKNTFKAAMLLRKGLLLGSMLNNSESWININKSDLDNLEKPDTMLQRIILGTSGNPSKAFMCLELGIVPVKFVMMEKRLTFLKYILNENMSSMIRQVYEVLKSDSRKGDFINLVKQDLEDTQIDFTEEDIIDFKKTEWKKYVHKQVSKASFQYLIDENSRKSKTKHIHFDKLEMSEYLVLNRNTSLSKTIFNVRAGVLDIKSWNEWNYSDKLCVMCKMSEENIDHFMNCQTYGNSPSKIDWKDIFENDPDEQNTIAIEVKRRQKIRKQKLEEVGLPSNLAPLLQTPL